MSLLTRVRHLFQSPTATPARLPVVAQLAPSVPTSTDFLPGWEATAGAVRHPHQERRVAFRDNQVSGRCTGRMAELSGSTLLCAFEDLPAWLPSLAVRLSVRAAEGAFTVSLRRPDGEVVAVTAPGAVESEAQLVGGKLLLRCEADGRVAKGLRYKVVIV